MARSRWGEGPIDIAGGGGGARLPRLPSLPTGRIKAVAAIVGLLILLVTGYYQIEPDAVGVVQQAPGRARGERGIEGRIDVGSVGGAESCAAAPQRFDEGGVGHIGRRARPSQLGDDLAAEIGRASCRERVSFLV